MCVSERENHVFHQIDVHYYPSSLILFCHFVQFFSLSAALNFFCSPSLFPATSAQVDEINKKMASRAER
jgi:hypothetical protein